MTLVTMVLLCRRLMARKRQPFFLTTLVGDLLAYAFYFARRSKSC